MTACESIRTSAAGLAALPPDDPERAAAWAHARTCPDCARVVREAERLQALLAEAQPAALPPEAMGRVSRLVVGLRREDRRRIAWSAAAACAAALALVALAPQRSGAARDWILAAALCAGAAGLILLARRPTLAVVAAALAGAVVAAGLSGRAGPIEMALGLRCAALELASAGAVLGAAWLALRGGLTSIGLKFTVSAASAGALAGDAALHLTCQAHESLPHLLVFHVGGILLAAVVSSLVWRGTARAEA